MEKYTLMLHRLASEEQFQCSHCVRFSDGILFRFKQKGNALNEVGYGWRFSNLPFSISINDAPQSEEAFLEFANEGSL